LIPLRDQAVLRERFNAELRHPVKIDLFTQREVSIFLPGRAECQYCKPAREMLQELASLNDNLSLRVHWADDGPVEASKYSVERIPAVILRGRAAAHLKLYGFPGGTEFPAFIETIVDVSRGTSLLSEESRKKLARIKAAVGIQVFVTPACPHCPAMARLAFNASLENANVKAEVVEISEFPELAQRYQVRAVPLTVIAGGGTKNQRTIAGAIPEQAFVDSILAAAGLDTIEVEQPSGATTALESAEVTGRAAEKRSGSGLILP